MDLLIDPILTIATTLYSLCEEVRANKNRCMRLKDRVEGLKQVLMATKRKGAQISPEVDTALNELKGTLESATVVVKKYKADNESLIKRILNTFNPGDDLESLNNRLNDAFHSLSLNLLVEVDPNLHKLFDSASQQEADEAARKKDYAEMQKMLQEVVDQQDTMDQKLEPDAKADIKQFIEMLQRSEILPKDIRKIKPAELTYDSPEVPVRKTFTSEAYKGEYRKYPVAIKRYLRTRPEGPRDAKREFEKEIKTMTHYESPHILQMFGVCFQDDEVPTGLIVMEYCEKGSLREVLYNLRYKTSGEHELRWDRKARMCLDAAQGVYILHQSEQKKYTQITSDNFIVAEGYRVKLRGLEMVQSENERRSDLRYISPEQLESLNHLCCKTCQIYSLGLVLWEIATRMKALEECYTDMKVYKHVCEEKQVLEPLPEDCPKKLGELINACRGYDASQRPTAGVLVDKLRQVVEQLEE